MKDYIAAHKYSSNHKEELLKDEKCGCFCCLTIFTPEEIEEWVMTSIDGVEDTALCPCCGIDSVIGESSGYPITEGFLTKMNLYWFLGC